MVFSVLSRKSKVEGRKSSVVWLRLCRSRFIRGSSWFLVEGQKSKVQSRESVWLRLCRAVILTDNLLEMLAEMKRAE